jgi:hypothetical protein
MLLAQPAADIEYTRRCPDLIASRTMRALNRIEERGR